MNKVKRLITKEQRELINMWNSVTPQQRQYAVEICILKHNSKELAESVLNTKLNDLDFQRYKNHIRKKYNVTKF